MNNASVFPEEKASAPRIGGKTAFALIYIIIMNTTYLPLDFLGGGFGPLKLLMIISDKKF